MFGLTYKGLPERLLSLIATKDVACTKELVGINYSRKRNG